MSGYFITREVLANVFGEKDLRSRDAFERFQRRFADVEESVTANVDATTALKDAAFVTLSPNAELPNERVLAFGRGIVADVTASRVTLSTTGPVVNGGFAVQFIVAGDTNLSLPLYGTVATREWVNAQGFGAGGGGYTYAATAVSYTETATTGEKVVAVTATAQTVTLPTAVGNTAKLTFKLMVAGTLTVAGAGGQTIDGGATAVLNLQYEAITLASNNANWIVI